MKLFLIFIFILSFSFPVFAKPLEKVTLQLRWHHQFQFAGYYMASQKGFYRDAGLDVTIYEASETRPSAVKEVVSGRAQYGVGNSGLINERIDGKPVVVLAAIFQTSPNAWILRKDSHISTVIGLLDKRLMMTKDVENVELLALFQNEGVDVGKLNIIESSFNINDLIDKKVDAFNGYLTNEPYYLKERGIEYTIIDPREYGIDFYSDCLFTSDNEVSYHPERVKAFREASLKGWIYALNNKEETIDVILANYSNLKTRDHLKFEADAIHKLMIPELIEVGHINPARWDRIVKTYNKLGFAKSNTIPEGFLYNQNPIQNNILLYIILSTIIVILAIATAITLYFYRLNSEIKE